MLNKNDTKIKRALYKKKLKILLKKSMVLKNLNMSPQLEKIVINMGLGIDGNDSKIIKTCEEDLSKITGQKPVITKFKNQSQTLKQEKILMQD